MYTFVGNDPIGRWDELGLVVPNGPEGAGGCEEYPVGSIGPLGGIVVACVKCKHTEKNTTWNPGRGKGRGRGRGLNVGAFDSVSAAITAALASGSTVQIQSLIAMGALSAQKAAPILARINNLHHIFGKARHALGPLLRKFGQDQDKALKAVEAALKGKNLPPGEVFEGIAVKVKGIDLVVRGFVKPGGIINVSTMWVKPR